MQSWPSLAPTLRGEQSGQSKAGGRQRRIINHRGALAVSSDLQCCVIIDHASTCLELAGEQWFVVVVVFVFVFGAKKEKEKGKRRGKGKGETNKQLARN